jgi:PEGA domain
MRFPAVSILCLGVLVFAAGCAAPRKTIAIDSDPRGVRVEVNNEYLGTTPLDYTLETNGAGEFVGSWGPAPYVEFVAYPPRGVAGLYVQRKVFRPNGFFQAGDKIPAKMFFDMHQKQEGLQIDINPK